MNEADQMLMTELWRVQKLDENIGEHDPSVKDLASTGKDLQDFCKGQCFTFASLLLTLLMSSFFLRNIFGVKQSFLFREKKRIE